VTEDVSFLLGFRFSVCISAVRVGAVGMWKSQERFPSVVGREGNRVWFSALSTTRHFHRLFPAAFLFVLSKPRLPVEAAEEFLFGRLHPCGRLRVGLAQGVSQQTFHGLAGAQVAGRVGL